MNPEKFTKRFKIPASAIDALDHVNNITYLQWCLDVAEQHWVEKASEKLQKKYVWVVLNHFISYKAPSFLNEEIEVQTWIENAEGVKCDRHYKIVRLVDEKILIEAKTLWCLLDAKSFKPTKITEEISRLF